MPGIITLPWLLQFAVTHLEVIAGKLSRDPTVSRIARRIREGKIA